MRYILTPVGSSGDVHPLVGIGRCLRRRDHEVILITAENFRDISEKAGLRFVPSWSREDFDRVTRHPDLWDPRRGFHLVLSAVSENLRRGYDLLSKHYQPGTILVGHTLSLATRIFADKQRATMVTLHLAPNIFRSRFQQPALAPGKDLSRVPVWIKRGFWWIVDKFLIDPHIAPAVNDWRGELGLSPVSRVFDSWIHSPQRVIGLFPEWFGPPQPDWPPQLELTGFPLFDEADEYPPDPGLEKFMAEGEAPILFTPGSANRQAPVFFETAVEASLRAGRRALLATPYREQIPADLPDHARHISYVPFSQILPRCAAIVHHGGIGTCAQGLAAGIPQLVMPMAFDQPDNAMRLSRLGVGAWVELRHFTPDRVANQLKILLSDPQTARACLKYRETMTKMSAVERTCDLIENLTPRAKAS